jgi:hypothetical protein
MRQHEYQAIVVSNAKTTTTGTNTWSTKVRADSRVTVWGEGGELGRVKADIRAVWANTENTHSLTYRCNSIGICLDRRFLTLRRLDLAHNLRKHRLISYRFNLHNNGPVHIDRRTNHLAGQI